jgi:hypothetical protein
MALSTLGVTSSSLAKVFHPLSLEQGTTHSRMKTSVSLSIRLSPQGLSLWFAPCTTFLMELGQTPKTLAMAAAPFLRHRATYRPRMICTCPGVNMDI